MRYNLKNIGITDQYEAWKFPGGELHVKLKEYPDPDTKEVVIKSSFRSADDIMFFAIFVGLIKKERSDIKIIAEVMYFAYQQADRDFGPGECFSLHTLSLMLNALPVSEWYILDPHSDVTPALMNAKAITNATLVMWALNQMGDCTIVSPDAGAYKKISKLVDVIGFEGKVVAANKSREADGSIKTLLSGEVDGRCVIIDDICVGGRTFIQLGEELHKAGALHVDLIVTHGVFSNGFSELRKTIDTIYTTNSVKELGPETYGVWKEFQGRLNVPNCVKQLNVI